MSAPVTPESVDRLVEAWEQRLARVDQNLVALESEPTYQVLARPGGMKASLEGATRQRVVPALDAMDRLFESRERLTGILAQAKEERERISALTFWENDDHLKTVVELLEGPSILLASGPVPLSSRELLGVAVREVSVTPEQLLAEMVRSYETARDAVSALSRAWADLEPSLEAAERELDAVKQRAGRLPSRSAVATEVEAAAREIAHARRRVAVDPLGAETSFVHVLRPRVEALRKRVEADAALCDEVTSALGAARDAWRSLERGREAAVAARARAATRYTGATWPPTSDAEALAGVGEWLRTIERTAAEGRWGPARVGLVRWREAARDIEARDAEVVRAADDRERWREELAGRLVARAAQSRALSTRALANHGNETDIRARLGAVDAAASAARALLEAIPVDVARAERAVEALERAVDELRSLAQ